ncbi:MAG: MoxR family ATPase [Dehalococcoidia bacterium]|nr:MoxR family ATPase [Dehalococcoidia bacterium]
MADDAGRISQVAALIRDSIEKVIVGKSDAVELALVALLCEGHVLIEDVPGIGKTMLAKSIARSVGCTFRRIQFTPDLLPSDITGISMYNQKSGEFEYRPGPVLSQIVLADEINRATPRTQSALLECMEERQITVEGETKPLPRPFLVMATQNPIELEGTFPLPEAQLDRFLLRIRLGYPSEADEHVILSRFKESNPLDELAPAVSAEDLLDLQRLVRHIYVDPSVEDYIVRIVRASRSHPSIELGASPRATLALYRATQALSAVRCRAYVIPDDVKHLAPFVLTHRLIASSHTRLRGHGIDQIMAEIIQSVEVPVEEASTGTSA